MPISDKEYIADLGECMTKLEADLAALREENARLKDDLHIKTAEWTTMMEENALLRSVLKRIAGDGCGMATKPDEPCHKLYVREDDWCWCCIARQALAREEK